MWDNPVRRAGLILGVTAIALLSVLGATIIFKKPVVPKQLTAATVSFKLFYPKSLPPHLEVDTKTIQVSDVAVIMQVRDATGKKAAITEQARPANFDFESLTAGKRFTTPSGDAIINTNGTITTVVSG
jgi:hypothetical protein